MEELLPRLHHDEEVICLKVVVVVVVVVVAVEAIVRAQLQLAGHSDACRSSARAP